MSVFGEIWEEREQGTRITSEFGYLGEWSEIGESKEGTNLREEISWILDLLNLWCFPEIQLKILSDQ